MNERKNHTRSEKPMEKAKWSHPKAQENLNNGLQVIIKLQVTLAKSVWRFIQKFFQRSG